MLRIIGYPVERGSGGMPGAAGQGGGAGIVSDPTGAGYGMDAVGRTAARGAKQAPAPGRSGARC